MMRAWILRRGADADGSLFQWEPAPGHLASASWVDGTGDVADSFEATLMGLDSPDVDILLSTRLSLLLAPPADPTVADLLTFGPYDVEPASVSGENRTWRVSGRVGSHFESTIADREDDARLYAELQDAIISRLASSEPWVGWAAGAGAPAGAAASDYEVSAAFIWGQVQAELVNAVDLSGVRQILKRWGLTATPVPASVDTTGFSHRVRVEPLYRPETLRYTVAPGLTVRLTSLGAPALFRSLAAAGAINLADDHLDAHPAIEWPDGLNRPEDFRRREITGVNRFFGDRIDDNTILTAGTLKPAVNIRADNGTSLLKVREEVERWQLQNSAAMLTPVRRFAAPYTDVAHAFVTPYQLVTIGLHQRPPGSTGAVWQVRQVNHQWDEEKGYSQTLKCSIWQGSFERTSGNAVKQLSV